MNKNRLKLREEMLEEQKPYQEIATRCGVSYNTFVYYIDKKYREKGDVNDK